jgi:polysaccharide export outer membrane protein
VPPPAPSPTTPRESTSEGPYLIRPNDLLDIYVWKNPEIGGPVKVQPDGNLSIPLVQDIQAAGLTPGQLKLAIERRLRDRLESPDVTVILKEVAGYRVSVTGKVKKPGPVASETALTVLDALALAGGFEDYAKHNQIRIIRTVTDADGQRRTTNYSFNYAAVIEGYTDQNLLLKAGDIVVVP